MTRPFYGILLPAVTGLALTTLLFLTGGIIVYIFGLPSLIFLFGISFLALGVLFGRVFREQSWRSGIWLTIPYWIWLAFALISILSFNLEHHGVFVRVEFFPVAVLLYLSPVLIACAGAYVGSDFSFRPISILVTSLIVTFAAMIYTGFSSRSGQTNTFSLDLIENKEVHLQAHITCERIISKNYMQFFNADRSDCSYSKITVLKKPEDYPLPTNIFITINETKESHPITPEGGIHGVSNSLKQDFDNTKVWIVFLPWLKIARSDRVNFTWGKINADLGESEFKSLRETVGTYDH